MSVAVQTAPQAQPVFTLACGPYDRMMPLFTGQVPVAGADLAPRIIQQPTDIFGRMLRAGEFDLAEMSLTHCYALLGKAAFTALPVFPSRMFRHGFIFVNKRSGIASPKDLAGRRVGVQGHQMTAAVWIRGMLRRDHGVNLDDVDWVEGGVNEPVVVGGADTRLRPSGNVRIGHAAPGETLNDLLAAGKIDALIGAVTPKALAQGGDVVRLFPDYVAAERDYYARTGIFPIMHALVIRNDVHARSPWLAAAVFDACCAARDLALKQARFTASLSTMLPWLPEHVADTAAAMGADWWAYGLERNRKALTLFAEYLRDDGYLATATPPEQVFVALDGGAP